MSDPISARVEQLLTESPIGPAQAAKCYGTCRDGRPTHPSTVVRHITKGIRLSDGTVLRLEGFRLGGRLLTSRAAVVRFIAAQQGADLAVPTPLRSPAERATASATAEARLKALGM